MNPDSGSCRAWVLIPALLILAGCAATSARQTPPFILSLEPCPTAVAPLDTAALAAPHKTLAALIALGETTQGRLLSAQCAYENAARKSDYLLAVGRQLKADLSDYLRRDRKSTRLNSSHH